MSTTSVRHDAGCPRLIFHGALVSRKKRKSRPRAIIPLSPDAFRPKCHCPGQYRTGAICWDCQSRAMLETVAGAAALWSESHGCDVLDCLIRAEEIVRTGVWSLDHVDASHTYRPHRAYMG